MLRVWMIGRRFARDRTVKITLNLFAVICYTTVTTFGGSSVNIIDFPMDRRHFLLLLFAAAGCRRNDSQAPEDFVLAAEENAVPPAESDPNNILLRYRFRKGEELRWNVQHSLKMKNIISGVEENIETRSRSAKIWKTLDVDAQGTATFEYRVEDIDLHKSQTGSDDAFYNSRRDRTIPPEFINLEGKIGVALAQIIIDPQGITTKKPLREYDGRISENRIVIPFPDEGVDIGASWSEIKPIDLPQPNQTVKKIRIRQTFTLEKIHSGLATIKFVTLSLTPLTPKEESQLIEHFSVGTMELDLDAGHFIRQQATIDKMVVGYPADSDSIRYECRMTECCCGRRACDICNISQTV